MADKEDVDAVTPTAAISEKDLTDSHAIDKTSVARFEQYIKENPDADLNTIVPASIIGVEKIYLAAVQANVKAEHEHSDALSQSRNLTTRCSERKQSHSSGASLLAQRLDFLRQKQHCEVLAIIDHYVRALDEAFTEHEERVSEVQLSLLEQLEVTKVSLQSSLESSAFMINKLEVAVAAAAHTSHLEHDTLRDIQEKSTGCKALCSRSQLQALQAVRNELTFWLENSLAVCDSTDKDEGQIGLGPHQASEELFEDACREYQVYVEARRDLLKVTQALSAPIRVLEQAVVSENEAAAVRVALSLKDDLVQLEDDNLGRRQRKVLELLNSHTASEVAKEATATSEQLQRLVDESQLLFDYPILARSGKFHNALGIKSRLPETKNDRLAQCVEAWEFATAAASDVLHSTVGKHVKEGMHAIEQARVNLAGSRILSQVAGSVTESIDG